jgi:hypothetical protein
MYKFFVLLALFTVYVVIFPTSGNTAAVIGSGPNFRSNKIIAEMNDSLIGIWGGKHISLEVSEQGAKIEYDCANGTIDKKIILDKNHRFNVLGTHTEEHGGPLRENNAPNSYPARFVGQIKGKQMTLTIKRKDNNKVIGTFKLIHGGESFLVKCR